MALQDHVTQPSYGHKIQLRIIIRRYTRDIPLDNINHSPTKWQTKSSENYPLADTTSKALSVKECHLLEGSIMQSSSDNVRYDYVWTRLVEGWKKGRERNKVYKLM